MPDSRWLSPLFWLGAALTFVASALWLRGFDNIAGWLALLIAWMMGAVAGWIVTALFLCRFPDAKYLTRDKVDKSDCVWNSADALMPYLVVGVFLAMVLLLNQFGSRPTHPYLPRLNRSIDSGASERLSYL